MAHRSSRPTDWELAPSRGSVNTGTSPVAGRALYTRIHPR